MVCLQLEDSPICFMEDDIDALLQMNTVSICSSNLMGDNLYHNQIYEESKREIRILIWPQNSKTTFIVQTFPKYGPYAFYFMNLSLMGTILAIFQFC